MACCDWLASDSAEIANWLRRERACWFAVSSFRSALVRSEAPVSRILTTFLVKLCRFCTIVRFDPKVDAWLRSVEAALVN